MTPLPPDLFGPRASAVLSDCGRYRYLLTRIWNETAPAALFVMLNPSTADANADDPTIRRCIGFARAWDCGAIRVINLFALRHRNPRKLLRAADPVGPGNDATILIEADKARREGGPVVCAWGARGGLNDRDMAVMEILRGAGADPLCIRKTGEGLPAHPLYLPRDLLTQPYEGRR